MTKAYALVQLLRLGPLALREIYEITGWNKKAARRTVYACRDKGLISGANYGRTRIYFASSNLIEK